MMGILTTILEQEKALSDANNAAYRSVQAIPDASRTEQLKAAFKAYKDTYFVAVLGGEQEASA